MKEIRNVITQGIRPFAWATAAVVAILVVLSASGILQGYDHYVTELTSIYVITTVGLCISIGLTGQFQMAQPALMGIAAYTTSILTVDAGWDFLPAALAAIVLVVLLGLGAAMLTRNLRTHYLLLGTFALQIIVADGLRQLRGVTGGVNGRQATVDVFGMQGSTAEYTIFLVLVTGVVVVVAEWISRSNLGLAMRGARGSDLLLNSAGTSAQRIRVVTVVISALYAAIAGTLIGPVVNFLVPESFGDTLVLLFVLMVVIGGSSSVWAVAASTALLSLLLEGTRSPATAAIWPIVFGLALMVILVAAPGGFAAIGSAVKSAVTRRRARSDSALTASPLAVSDTRADAANVIGAGTSAASGPMVVRDIAKSYGGVRALAGVSFTVEPNSVHGLIGPNGSGKTTLLDVVCGFTAADSGEVRLGDVDVTGANAQQRARRGIRRSFQHPLLVDDVSALQNIMLGASSELNGRAWLTGVDGRQNGDLAQRADSVLTLLGMTDRAHVLAKDLSYGERKLIDIGRSVMARPTVLVLDEPVAGLPASEVERVRALVGQLRTLGFSVLIVEHNMRLMMEMCDSITVISSGELLVTGPPEVVQNDARVIEVYLGTDSDVGAGPAAEVD